MKIDLNPGLKGLSEALSPQEKRPSEDFMTFLKQELKEVDSAQKEADARVLDLATGRDPDLVGVSLALTRAELSFRFLLQIRNKILEAYQEIMRMQL